MKLSFRDIEPFVKKPNPEARVILVYGPDQGLMKERSKTMCQTAVPDLNDPFNVVTFTADKITDDPASFYDEANAQSLMGGNRLIIIKNGADSLNVILKDYLENPSQDTLVVVEAENLGPRSSLRKLCEGAKNAAAVPCYVDDERNLSQIVRDMCTHAGYNIDRDAIMALSSALVGDRSIARNEIEKLILYKGIDKDYQGFNGNPCATKMGAITLLDVQNCCGDVRDWSIDSFVYAICEGNVQETHKIIEALFKDQVPVVVLLRSLQNHFWKLLSVQSKIKSGLSMPEAIKTMNPPLFFKLQDAFKRQLSLWPLTAIETAICRLNDIEAKTKQTGYSDIALMQNLALQLARYPQLSRQRAA